MTVVEGTLILNPSSRNRLASWANEVSAVCCCGVAVFCSDKCDLSVACCGRVEAAVAQGDYDMQRALIWHFGMAAYYGEVRADTPLFCLVVVLYIIKPYNRSCPRFFSISQIIQGIVRTCFFDETEHGGVTLAIEGFMIFQDFLHCCHNKSLVRLTIICSCVPAI